jgi:PTH1 family peptidyl-tRNA hydrolase
MKLIVGLGNPGRKYEGTRHNVGWAILAELARKHSGSKPKQNFQGEIIDADIDGQRALLLAPHTYMNRSGQSVVAARDFYKIENAEILVLCDDLNLPLGKLRIRPGGSAGGQKGLADVIRALGTEQVPRLRIGIDPAPDNWDAADFVLSKFKKEEREEINHAIARAADAVSIWAHEGMKDCMNRIN